MTPARIALTFDTEHPDRPHEPDAEGRLLALLERHGIRATFLLHGRWVEAYPNLARSIATAGHLIGNHSHYHVRMPLLTPAGFDTDIRAAEEAIRSLVGVDPRPWFRFPFGAGATDAALHARLETLGYRHLGWDVNVEEWMPGSTADGVAAAILAALDTAPRDAIVLLHAWPTPVVGALERVVPVIQDRGGSFVGVDELGAGAAVTIPA